MKIETREQLIEVIRQAAIENEYVTLYEELPIVGRVREVKFYPYESHIGRPIHSDGESSECLYYTDIEGYNDRTALSDRNIGGDHNDNWWFTTYEEAAKHAQPSVTVEINLKDAPEWLKCILNNEKINAIKDIRASITGRDPNTGTVVSAGLKSSKDFIEAFQNCIKKV